MTPSAEVALGLGRAALAFALWLAASPASAASTLALELRDDLSLAAHRAALTELERQLEAFDVLVEPQDIAELRNELLPLPGRWNEELELPTLLAQLEAGVRSYLRGNFRAAVQQLEAALALAHRNPALVVSDAGSRQWMTQALVSLALARARLGDRAGAEAALAEQIRSYPELPVTRAAFGRRGEALYASAQRALEAGRRGSLLVDVSVPDARIYINEYGRGRGGAFSSDALPGTYRVLVVVGARSRSYRLAVHADEQARLRVDWNEDSALLVSPTWLGFAAAASSPRADQACRALAKRLVFHDAIALGRVDSPAGPALWAAVYERATGRRLRSATLPLTRADATALARLAAYLVAGDHPADLASSTSLAVLTGEPAVVADDLARAVARAGRSAPRAATDAPATPPGSLQAAPAALASAPASSPTRVPTASRRATSWIGWALTGLGAAAIGAGVTTAALVCERDSCGRDPATLAWAAALGATGLVSCGVGALLHLDARGATSSRPAPSVRSPAPPAPTPGAGAQWRPAIASRATARSPASKRSPRSALLLSPSGALATVSWTF